MIKLLRCFTNPVPPEDDCHNNGRRHFSCLSLQLALLPPAVQFISHFILRLFSVKVTVGLPWWLCGKEPAPQRRRQKRRGFDLWVGKIPWRRKWQPTPVFLPGESHEHRNISCHINKQEMSEDGGGVGRGEHFLPHKFIKRAFKRRVNSTKQLLNAGRGHQAPRKATQLFERR